MLAGGQYVVAAIVTRAVAARSAQTALFLIIPRVRAQCAFYTLFQQLFFDAK